MACATQASCYALAMKIAAIFLLGAICACTTIEEQHGVAIKPKEVAALTLDSSKSDVVSVLGSPSTKSIYGDEVWYYLSNRKERNIFAADELAEQEVLAISFDVNAHISNVETYSLSDSRKFAVNQRITETSGNDVSFMEQILGNVGRFSPDAVGGRNSKF